MKPAGTLLLTRSDVASLLDLDECISAVETAFRLRGEGKAATPGILGFPAEGGGFHARPPTRSRSSTAPAPRSRTSQRPPSCTRRPWTPEKASCSISPAEPASQGLATGPEPTRKSPNFIMLGRAI